jgi:hypothetical protein
LGVSGVRSLGSKVETSIPVLFEISTTGGIVSPPSIMMNFTSSSWISFCAPVRALSGAYSLS